MKKANSAILFLLRIFFAILFFYSAYSKLAAPLDFAGAIENYQVFGPLAARWIAVFVPMLELLVGFMLLTGLYKQEAFVLTIFLFLIFDVIVLQAYLRGLDISCGCFGESLNASVNFWKITENTVLTLLALWGWVLLGRLREIREIQQ
ncbi:MAG: MauE/DoxX family redox-associated membrane protein [Calditrichia bacterium]